MQFALITARRSLLTCISFQGNQSAENAISSDYFRTFIGGVNRLCKYDRLLSSSINSKLRQATAPLQFKAKSMNSLLIRVCLVASLSRTIMSFLFFFIGYFGRMHARDESIKDDSGNNTVGNKYKFQSTEVSSIVEVVRYASFFSRENISLSQQTS